MPDTWTRYNEVDALLVPVPLLQRIQQEAPEKWKVIREWIGCGGILWCYGKRPPEKLMEELLDDSEDWSKPELALLQRAEQTRLDSRDIRRKTMMDPFQQSGSVVSQLPRRV